MTVEINYVTEEEVNAFWSCFKPLMKDEFILVDDIPCVLDQMLAEYWGYV